VTRERAGYTRQLLVAALLACALPLQAVELENAGFEADVAGPEADGSWEVFGSGQVVERDFDTKTGGAASLRVTSETRQSSTMLRQTFAADALRDGGLRLTGHIRTRGLEGTATLFVVVNDADTRIFLDDMRGRPVQGDAEWTPAEIRVPRLPNARTIEMGVLVIGAGVAWFDDLDVERVVNTAETTDVAADYLAEALAIMEARSVHSPGANWVMLREEARIAASGSQVPSDTYPAIRLVLRRLGDSHSSLFTPERAARVVEGGADSTALPKWEPPVAAIINERIASISVPAYTGVNTERMSAYADELQARVRELDTQGPCGWIVDLRQNTGGNVFAMLAGIGPVLGEGDAGGGVAIDGTEVVRSYANGRSGRAAVSGEPYELRHSSPPVAVLLGPNTASSGEAVALAFVGRPDTRTFGERTAGYTTGNVPIPLSDGAVLNLAVTAMTDRNRQVYRGAIEPDVVITGSPGADQAPDAVVAAAAAWLEANDACAEAR